MITFVTGFLALDVAAAAGCWGLGGGASREIFVGGIPFKLPPSTADHHVRHAHQYSTPQLAPR